ncbi:MAG: FecR domain-containing protein [Myxococcota bacterium]
MSTPHLSEFELDRLASGTEPTAAQREALESSPALRAQLEERRKGLNAFPELDEQRLLASIRRRAATEEPTVASVVRDVSLGWERLRFALLGAAATLAVSLILRSIPGPPPKPTPLANAPTEVPAAAPAVLALSDGSRVTSGRESRVEVERVSEKLVALQLRTGRASFDVAKKPDRDFQVRVENVVVHVVGTQFTVERSGEDAKVSVTEGRVRVEAPSGTQELGAGETNSFAFVRLDETERGNALEALDQQLSTEYAVADVEPAPGPKPPRKPPAKTNSWQKLAEAGEHDAAFEALQDQGSRVRNEVGELMLAADAARLSNHPREAAGYLERVVSEHARDPRAASAAFTLGGMLLRQLREPTKAARMFATARSLAPNGPLAGDALAREVQAWSTAGDKAKAGARAREYLRLYPNGARVKSVKRFGGLD